MALQPLLQRNGPTIVLDGDDFRGWLSPDLGFTSIDRHENARRAAMLSARLNEAGVSVIVAMIAPLEKTRDMMQHLNPHLKIAYVQCPAEVCEARDVKGHWNLARKGKLYMFTGVDSPYETPEDPDWTLPTDTLLDHKDLANLIYSDLAPDPMRYPDNYPEIMVGPN
jgi:adenylylsulfate kinase